MKPRSLNFWDGAWFAGVWAIVIFLSVAAAVEEGVEDGGALFGCALLMFILGIGLGVKSGNS